MKKANLPEVIITQEKFMEMTRISTSFPSSHGVPEVIGL
jgi:hypothetical protein